MQLTKKSPWRSLRIGQLRNVGGGGGLKCSCTHDPVTRSIRVDAACPVHGWGAVPSF